MATKIVFFGSGPVAAASLALLNDDFEIEAVVTKPTTKSEMVATTVDAPIYCVSDKKELDTLFTTTRFESTIAILIDFGIIVSQNIIDYFPKGIVNSHFSLLPELRGADPISFVILEGRDKTGVSLMLLVKAMDEGPVLSIGEQLLDGTETGISLTNMLISLSHTLLRDTIPAYVDNIPSKASGVIPKPLDQKSHCELLNKEFKPTYTRKLTKSDGIIDWNKSALQIEREIRAFNDWPKSRTTFGNIDCVITKAHTVPSNFGDPGEVEKSLLEDKILAVQTSDGYLCIDKIKPAGKNEMDIAGFLNGYKNKIIK